MRSFFGLIPPRRALSRRGATTTSRPPRVPLVHSGPVSAPSALHHQLLPSPQAIRYDMGNLTSDVILFCSSLILELQRALTYYDIIICVSLHVTMYFPRARTRASRHAKRTIEREALQFFLVSFEIKVLSSDLHEKLYSTLFILDEPFEIKVSSSDIDLRKSILHFAT